MAASSSNSENKKDVTVTVDGRRYVVDRQHLRTPDNLTNREKIQRAADKVGQWEPNGYITVPNFVIRQWLALAAKNADTGCCCGENCAGLSIAAHILGRKFAVATPASSTYSFPYQAGTTWTWA